MSCITSPSAIARSCADGCARHGRSRTTAPPWTGSARSPQSWNARTRAPPRRCTRASRRRSPSSALGCTAASSARSPLHESVRVDHRHRPARQPRRRALAERRRVPALDRRVHARSRSQLRKIHRPPRPRQARPRRRSQTPPPPPRPLTCPSRLRRRRSPPRPLEIIHSQDRPPRSSTPTGTSSQSIVAADALQSPRRKHGSAASRQMRRCRRQARATARTLRVSDA